MLIVIPHVERRYILEGFFFFIAMPMKTNILLQYFIFLLIFAMLGLRYHERSSLAVGSRGYSSCAWAFHCSGFSCGGAQARECVGFSSGTRAQQLQLPESRLNSCGTQA